MRHVKDIRTGGLAIYKEKKKLKETIITVSTLIQEEKLL